MLLVILSAAKNPSRRRVAGVLWGFLAALGMTILVGIYETRFKSLSHARQYQGDIVGLFVGPDPFLYGMGDEFADAFQR